MRTTAALMAALFALLVVAGCAGFDEREDNYDDQRLESEKRIAETRAYVQEAQLEKVSTIRYEQPMELESLNPRFAIIHADDGRYLIEVHRFCPDLMNVSDYATHTSVRAAAARNLGILRTNQDSLRGCRVVGIYKLPEK